VSVPAVFAIVSNEPAGTVLLSEAVQVLPDPPAVWHEMTVEPAAHVKELVDGVTN
jgi:hypothetical protein